MATPAMTLHLYVALCLTCLQPTRLPLVGKLPAHLFAPDCKDMDLLVDGVPLDSTARSGQEQ